MSIQQQTQNKKPLLCKWCKKVEITFSKSKLSPNGKMIPLNIHSLEPHRCQENPYYQQKQEVVVESGTKEPIIQEQPTIQLLNEVLYQIGELRKEIQELKK